MTKYQARPPEVNIITDFVNAIHDPRIEYLTNVMCNHNSIFDTFDKAATKILAHMGSITQKSKAKQTSTNISSANIQSSNNNRSSNRRCNRGNNNNINSSNTTSDLDGKYQEDVKGLFTGKIEIRSYPLKVWTKCQRQKVQDLWADQGQLRNRNWLLPSLLLSPRLTKKRRSLKLEVE